MQIDRTGAEPRLVFDRGVSVPAAALLAALANCFVAQIIDPEVEGDEGDHLESQLLEEFPSSNISAQDFCQHLEYFGAEISHDDHDVMEAMKRKGLFAKVDFVVEGGVSYALYAVRNDAFMRIANTMAKSKADRVV